MEIEEILLLGAFFSYFNINVFLKLSKTGSFIFRAIHIGSLFYEPVIFTLIFTIAIQFIKVPLEDKSSQGIWTLKEGRAVARNIHRAGMEYKRIINETKNDVFNKIKFCGVPYTPRDRGEPSRGSEKLRVLLDVMRAGGAEVKGTFIDLCAGAGGWSFVMDECGLSGTAISFWKQHAMHAQWAGPERVHCIQGDIGSIQPFTADWILSDGGEGLPNYDKEEQRHSNLLTKVVKWIERNPNSNFIIKVLSPTGMSVQRVLRRIQSITGKGALVRLDMSRLSTSEMYLVSLPKEDVEAKAYSCIRELIVKWLRAKDNPPERQQTAYRVKDPQWGEVYKFKGLDPLDSFDYVESISWFVRSHAVQKARNITGFLKEVCYFYSLARGSSGGPENAVMKSLLRPLYYAIPGFNAWKSTSTTPEATFRMVLEKVDKAPKEEHEHWELIRAAYDVFGDYMVRNGLKLRIQSPEQVYHAANPRGTMSHQEAKVRYKGGEVSFDSIKEYANAKDPASGKYIWLERLKDVIKSFERGKPILAIFETTGKKEKKQDFTRFKDRGSRLIWFLPATMRLFEQMVFGGLEELLSKVPFTVSGRPLYDYGEMLAALFKDDVAAVADDIAGWDTRISKSMQILECNLLTRLAKGAEHKKYIVWLYRLYSNACVAIDRHYPGETDAETAIFKCQGQVASGRRPTYAMNTITNIILTLVSVAKARGMDDDHALTWMRSKLNKGQTSDLSMLVSGDDKVVLMEKSKIVNFAQEAYKFMNDIGLIRKDIQLDTPSRIITNMEDIEFCSNNYTKVLYTIKGVKVPRWMPIRGLHEIFGKSKLLLSRAKDDETDIAWAKMQGLNLFVNYHHIPEVRALALTILSIVDIHVNLIGLSVGWSYQAKPWIQDGDALEILSSCLFGESTTIPHLRTFDKISRVKDLGQVSQTVRKRYCALKTKDRKAWYLHLASEINNMRDHLGKYCQWYQHMEPLKIAVQGPTDLTIRIDEE